MTSPNDSERPTEPAQPAAKRGSGEQALQWEAMLLRMANLESRMDELEQKGKPPPPPTRPVNAREVIMPPKRDPRRDED